MGLAVAVLIAGAIALPHLMSLDRAAPPVAVAMWFCGLALRALAVLLLLIELVLFFPATLLFATLTHWCWHAVIPLLATHLGVNGHSIGDAALLVPTFALGISLISLTVGVARAARSVRRLLRWHSLGPGPLGSTVVPGPTVLVAAAGLRRPQVIVSAGALTALDDAELAAGLTHERGHIAHRHRLVLLLAQFCRSAGRWLPGADRAMRELVFHLERDADRWAVSRHHDPLALASAICKSAPVGTMSGTVLALSGAGAADRVSQLLDEEPRQQPGRTRRRLTSLIAIGLTVLTLSLAATIPAAAFAGANQLGKARPAPHCKG